MLKHPFQNSTTGVQDIGCGPQEQYIQSPGNVLYKVLTVTSVTGGQRITCREQTLTSRTNATAKNADSPAVIEALVPSVVGTVAVNDLVQTSPLPGMDQLFATPASASLSSFLDISTITDYTITASGVWQDTGFTFSLPAAGTYLLFANVSALVEASVLGSIVEISGRLYDQTAATPVPGTMAIIASSQVANRVGRGTSMMLTVYTVTAVSVIGLQGFRTSGSTWSQSLIGTGSVTGSDPSFGYVRIA